MKLWYVLLCSLAFAVIFGTIASWLAVYAFTYTIITSMATDYVHLLKPGDELLIGIIDLLDNDTVLTSSSSPCSIIFSNSHVMLDCHSQLRSQIAQELQATMQQMVKHQVQAVDQISQMYHMGIVHFDFSPESPWSSSSCLLLGILCSHQCNFPFSTKLSLATATGGELSCSALQATMLRSDARTSKLTQEYLGWAVTSDSEGNAGVSMMAHCMDLKPNVFPVYGTRNSNNCVLPCNYDPRRQPWYSTHIQGNGGTVWNASVVNDKYQACSMATISTPIFQPSVGDLPTLVGVLAVELDQRFISNLIGNVAASHESFVLIIANDSSLTVLGSYLANYSCQTTQKMNSASISGWSLTDSCFGFLQELGQHISRQDEPSATKYTTGAIIWDVFPSQVTTQLCYVAVGTAGKMSGDGMGTATKTVPSKEKGSSSTILQIPQFSENTSANQLTKEAVSQLRAMWTTSQEDQVKLVDRLQAKKLSQLTETMGWTVIVALGTAFLLIGVGANAIFAFARSILKLADMVDQAAEMKLDSRLRFPISRVSEVAQVQHSLLKLVERLSEYKAYMPAGLFEDIPIIEPELMEEHVEHMDMQMQTTLVDPTEGCLPPRSPLLVPRQVTPWTTIRSTIATTFRSNFESTMQSSPRSTIRSAARSSLVTTEEGTRRRSSDRSSGLPRAESRVQYFLNCVAPSSRCYTPSHDSPRDLGRCSPMCSSPRVLRMVNSIRTKMLRKNIAALVVNIVGFKANLFTAVECHLEVTLNHYVSVVHDIISKARGNIDAIVGDQILVTFNAHIPCSDPIVVSCEAGLNIQSALGLRVNLQTGICAGQAFVGNTGYGPFRAMVTLGTPMKVAGLLAHMHNFGEGSVLVDSSVEERIKYDFKLRPVDLVYCPQLGSHVPVYARNVKVYMVQSRKEFLEQEEWLYQVGSEAEAGDWETAFNKLATAETVEGAMRVLQQYLISHPDDQVALRLKSRMSDWRPRCGVPLCEGSEPIERIR